MPLPECLLCFEDELAFAIKLANAIGNCTVQRIERHTFPDGEIKLRLPAQLPTHVVILRSLHQPNEKLLELLLASQTARKLGAQHLTLVAPYLAYMRQDIAFVAGEAISQKIIGRYLADLFDAVVTVDPHLHRISRLSQAIPTTHAISLSAAPLLAEYVHKASPDAILMGPDEESSQWIDLAAQQHHFEHGVCQKIRNGDKDVEITLPPISVRGRHIVLLDDIASSGRTLARTTELLLDHGAFSVDVAVTHALFAQDAMQVLQSAGVRHVWSTDCVAHPSNCISVDTLIANAIRGLSFPK